jgi:soluble lytic murein transglycosylase-like protein
MTPTILAIFFNVATMQNGLPANLLESLCYVESTHNVAAVHIDDGNSSSLGICQVKLETARWLGFKGTAKELMEPKTNIDYAAKYLKYQINRYGKVNKAIIAYNRGNANGLTTSKYQDKVLKQWRVNNERKCTKRTCEL